MGMRSSRTGPTQTTTSDAPGTLITNDETLAAVGGLDANDRVEVLPWIKEDGRWSFCSSDPRAGELALFAGTAR